MRSAFGCRVHMQSNVVGLSETSRGQCLFVVILQRIRWNEMKTKPVQGDSSFWFYIERRSFIALWENMFIRLVFIAFCLQFHWCGSVQVSKYTISRITFAIKCFQVSIKWSKPDSLITMPVYFNNTMNNRYLCFQSARGFSSSVPGVPFWLTVLRNVIEHAEECETRVNSGETRCTGNLLWSGFSLWYQCLKEFYEIKQ